MFARYLLGDLFLHGIGGAKYDELGDAIARRFFGFEPPAYLTLSLTVWLGLETESAASVTQLHEIDRRLRELIYNPDRRLAHDDTSPELLSDAVREGIAAKERARSMPETTRAERLERFRAIRRSNEALLAHVETFRAALRADRAGVLAGLQRKTLARHREYSLVLHSRARLRSVFAGAIPAWDET